jgi:hypothetical protein
MLADMASYETFVPVERIANDVVDFAWSDWDPYNAVGDPPRHRVEALGKLSGRALVAYAMACAEWVVYRFYAVSDDRTPHAFLEALWVSAIDSRFRPPSESNEADWKGAVRGPIDLALMTALNTIASIDDGKPEVDAALAEQIALHVIAAKEIFVDWRHRVLNKLSRDFSKESDRGGSLGLPPQLFGVDYVVGDLDVYVKRYIESVDVAANAMIERARPPLVDE